MKLRISMTALKLSTALIALLCIVGCKSGPELQSGTRDWDYINVTWDNPDFTEFGVRLTPASTKWNGVMDRTIEVTPNGVAVGNGDFRLHTIGGDGPAKPNGVSVFASVGDEEIIARPDAQGTYATSKAPGVVDLQAHGLRVGFTPLMTRLFQIEPNHSSPAPFDTTHVRLDPNILLVPIEAVVVFHDKDSQGHLNGTEQQRRATQLMFWDHIPEVETVNITDGQFGELTTAQHAMPWVRRDKDGRFNVLTQMAPDAVWHRCGVQFRLVNYFEMQVPARNVFPVEGNESADPDRFWQHGTVDDAPLRDNVRRVKDDPRHMEGAVIVVFMQRVSFPDAPEVGRALQREGAIGVSLTDGRSTDGVVGHELGHLTGLRDATGSEKDAAGNPLFNVMIGIGPGVDPTDAECKAIKKWAGSFPKFWTEPHPER